MTFPLGSAVLESPPSCGSGCVGAQRTLRATTNGRGARCGCKRSAVSGPFLFWPSHFWSGPLVAAFRLLVCPAPGLARRRRQSSRLRELSRARWPFLRALRVAGRCLGPLVGMPAQPQAAAEGLARRRLQRPRLRLMARGRWPWGRNGWRWQTLGASRLVGGVQPRPSAGRRRLLRWLRRFRRRPGCCSACERARPDAETKHFHLLTRASATARIIGE